MSKKQKLKKRINSETEQFWQAVRNARLKVEKWPEWKQNIRLGNYKAKQLKIGV